MVFRNILECFFSQLAFRKDEAGWLYLSVHEKPCHKIEVWLFTSNVKSALNWFVSCSEKNLKQKLLLQVSDVFNTFQNKMVHQFILKMFLPMEKLDGLIDTLLPVPPSKYWVFKPAFASASEYSLSSCSPCLLQAAAETCNSVQKFLNFISATSTLPFAVTHFLYLSHQLVYMKNIWAASAIFFYKHVFHVTWLTDQKYETKTTENTGLSP